MPLLAGILSVLALLLTLVTVVGVIAPSLLRNRKTGQAPKRLSVLVWGCIGVFVCMVLAGSLVPAPPGSETGGAGTPGENLAPEAGRDAVAPE